MGDTCVVPLPRVPPARALWGGTEVVRGRLGEAPLDPPLSAHPVTLLRPG